MLPVVNIPSEFASISDYWSPKIIGRFNDNYIKLAKLKGEFVWHDHANEDEVFIIIKGELEIRYRDRSVFLYEGDTHVVPRATEHFPVAETECWVMLIEPASTAHTGDIITDRTRSVEEQLSDA